MSNYHAFKRMFNACDMSVAKKMNLILCIFFCGVTVLAQSGCNIPYATFPDKEPVLAYNSYDLRQPQGPAVVLNHNEQIVLSCPNNTGTKNSFVNFAENPILATCINGFLVVNGVSYTIVQFNCSKTVTGDITVTPDGVRQIGYFITKWDVAFFVKYDDSRAEAVYSQHTLYGSAIDYAKNEPSRPSFKSTGVASGVNVENAYKQTTQKSVFTTILGSSDIAARYINTGSYLARGHLTPDGDGVYVTSQFITYFLVNTVPQWQVINNGNWKSVESEVRTVASDLRKDLTVVTGGDGVLSLPDVDGNMKDIYLAGGKLPVPKLTWKLVYDADSLLGIVFVCVNNPFTTPASGGVVCDDVCERYNWGGASWKNYTKGYVSCCDYAGVKEKIAGLPEVGVVGVLGRN